MPSIALLTSQAALLVMPSALFYDMLDAFAVLVLYRVLYIRYVHLGLQLSTVQSLYVLCLSIAQ